MDAVINKGSRHSQIVGKFGEYMICNWLSRSHFEVVNADQTGIDIIAYNQDTKERLGITVKSRTRTDRSEKDVVFLFRQGDREKLQKACDAFSCVPWVAVYVETTRSSDLYLTSLKNFDDKYRSEAQTEGWKMSPGYKKRYEDDKEVKHIEIAFQVKCWWPSSVIPT